MRIIFISTWNHEDVGGALYQGCHRHTSGVAFDTLIEATEHQVMCKNNDPKHVATGVVLVTADDLER